MMNKKDLSLYVHIPFCVRKCLYCDFLSAPAGADVIEEYIKWLGRQIKAWGQLISKEYRIQTIFWGGGTPSCLTPDQILFLSDMLYQYWDIDEQVEFTTEANPGTVTSAIADAWKKVGINRVSLGLQSAQDEELKALGRIHTYREFLTTWDLLKEKGWDNLNIDLMADIPGQTLKSYLDTLEKVIALQPQHISAYSLIVEPGTPFYEMEQRGELVIAEEECDRAMYEQTRILLGQHGYRRYEISNYALEHKECRHNKVYWQTGSYLGLGLGASSYMEDRRFSNPSGFDAFYKSIRMIEALPADCGTDLKELLPGLYPQDRLEVLSRNNQMEEFMFLGLRMMEGVSRHIFQKRFGTSIDAVYGNVLHTFFEQNLLAEDGIHDRIYLTRRGIDVSNQIFSEFLLD